MNGRQNISWLNIWLIPLRYFPLGGSVTNCFFPSVSDWPNSAVSVHFGVGQRVFWRCCLRIRRPSGSWSPGPATETRGELQTCVDLGFPGGRDAHQRRRPFHEFLKRALGRVDGPA